MHIHTKSTLRFINQNLILILRIFSSLQGKKYFLCIYHLTKLLKTINFFSSLKQIMLRNVKFY